MDGGDDDDEHQVSAGVTLCSYFSRLLDQLSEKKNSQISHRGVFPLTCVLGTEFPRFSGSWRQFFCF